VAPKRREVLWETNSLDLLSRYDMPKLQMLFAIKEFIAKVNGFFERLRAKYLEMLPLNVEIFGLQKWPWS